MFDLLFLASIFGTGVQLFKEAKAPVVPAENWANKELYHKDMMDGVPIEQLMKNVQNGKYKLPKEYFETHPEPHRDPKTGKIIIENCTLYHEDVKEYGAIQAQKWVKEGKYNLTPEELDAENKRLDEEFEKKLELYRACHRKKYR